MGTIRFLLSALIIAYILSSIQFEGERRLSDVYCCMYNPVVRVSSL